MSFVLVTLFVGNQPINQSLYLKTFEFHRVTLIEKKRKKSAIDFVFAEIDVDSQFLHNFLDVFIV